MESFCRQEFGEVIIELKMAVQQPRGTKRSYDELIGVMDLPYSGWKNHHIKEFSQLKKTAFGLVDFGEFFDMVVFPSGVRQISVPWYQIVTISLFDIPIFKDR